MRLEKTIQAKHFDEKSISHDAGLPVCIGGAPFAGGKMPDLSVNRMPFGIPRSRLVTCMVIILVFPALWGYTLVRGEVGQQGPPFYSTACAKCHGAEAQGDGPGHSDHLPPPSNLTLVRNTESMTISIIENGVPGTSMPAVPLPASVIDPVLRFITDQYPDTTTEWEVPWELENTEPDVVYGATLYVTACIDCHGEKGDGKGSWAEDPRIWPKPADLRARSSQLGRLYAIVSNGRQGTMMAPQKRKFPARSRWAMAGFAYSIFDSSSQAEIQVPDGMEKKTLENPLSPDDKDAVDSGEEHYRLYCAYCHNAGGKGGFLAPRLIDRQWDYGGGTDTDLFVLIEKGIPGRLMPSHRQLDEEARWRIITYLRHRGGKPDHLAADPVGHSGRR